MKQRIPPEDLRGKTVHILWHGLPICGFSTDPPKDWPDGHYWLGLKDDPALITCPGCRTERELYEKQGGLR